MGLRARLSEQRSFSTSFDKYVPPGSGYELLVYNNGTHDLCPYVFSKTLEHDPVTSFPLCSHVGKLIEAVSNPPTAESFNAIPLAPGSKKQLEGPQTSWDSVLMCSPATTHAEPTNVTDPEFGFEIAEVYAMALLRDKPFFEWRQDPDVQKVVDILNTYTHKSSAPLEGGMITMNTLMRGNGPDETVGPYVSQYLLQPFSYGNLRITQKYVMENDALKTSTWTEFIKIQDGQPSSDKTAEARESFNFCPRILGSGVHKDPLFQLYYDAALISFGCDIKPAGIKGMTPPKITAWTQGGKPDVFGAVSTVANMALKAAWWHKWQQAMRIRPEAVGGLFEFCKNNEAECEKVPKLRPMYDAFRQGLKDMTKNLTGGTLLLPLQYPEGSPTHPSWPAGHAVVAGACVTVLKAMLNTHGSNNEKLPWPKGKKGKCSAIEAVSGNTTAVCHEDDASKMTIVGELNKLASNAALGRNVAGVHYRSDGAQGMLLGEQIAIQYLKNKFQEYALKSISNSFTLEKFDGMVIEITAEEGHWPDLTCSSFTCPPAPWTKVPGKPVCAATGCTKELCCTASPCATAAPASPCTTHAMRLYSAGGQGVLQKVLAVKQDATTSQVSLSMVLTMFALFSVGAVVGGVAVAVVITRAAHRSTRQAKEDLLPASSDSERLLE